MDPKRYTRSNPDPNPSPLVYNLEIILRKQKTKSRQSGNFFPPLIKSNSLPMRFVTEDLVFSPSPGKSLIRTKSENFLSEATFDPFDFESFSPFSETFEFETNTEVWSNFHKIKGLVDKFQENSEKTYFQYQQQVFGTSWCFLHSILFFLLLT